MPPGTGARRQNESVPEERAIKSVEEMGPVHHIVLYWAVDGGPLISPLHGLSQSATPAGEMFRLFEPQPLDAVREATIDLVRAGLVVLHRSAPDEEREFRADEALQLLAEDSTWTGKHYYVLSPTKAGEDAFRTLHDRHGDAYRKAEAEAQRRGEEFDRRHPGDLERREEWVEALMQWTESGEGAMPEPPSYPDEPPPYEGDAPWYFKPPR